MAKRLKVDPSLDACARCGYTRGAHALANFADGPMIGAPVLICPFAQWKNPLPGGAVDPIAADPGKPSTRDV